MERINVNLSGEFTRRDLLRSGSRAAAVFAAGSLLDLLPAQQKRTPAPRRLRVDAHAHLWTDDYLDLVESYGKKDTSVQRNKGAGLAAREGARPGLAGNGRLT